MSDPTAESLQARIEALERENAELRDLLGWLLWASEQERQDEPERFDRIREMLAGTDEER